MSGKSSEGGYLSVEQSLVQVKATVMLYDEASRQWIFSNSCPSPSKVHIYQHMANNSFRVVGRSIEDRVVTINCLISRSLRYNQATPVFHQWRDSRQIYGLQFINKEEADSFADSMIASLELLNLGADQQPYHLHHQQQHHHQHQQQQTMIQRSTVADSNSNTITQTETYDSSQGYRYAQQHDGGGRGGGGGREEPGADDVGQPDVTQNHSEVSPYQHHHQHQKQQQQWQQEVQSSSPLPLSQTIPSSPAAARFHPPSMSKSLLVTTSSTSIENNSATTSNSSIGLSAPTNAIPPASAPPPPPPPPPPAAPIASQPPSKPSGIDLASALKGIKLRETAKSTETESKEATASGLQTMTLGRAAKVVPAFPPGSGTASVSRASGGPPPQQATRPKLNVMSEMEKKLKERKEKSEGGTTTTLQQMPKRGTAGPQELFQGNQPQQRTGSTIATASEEEILLQSLQCSAENNLAVQRTQEVKATRGGAVVSAVSSHGDNSRPILPAELEAVKVELVTKITQELEKTKQDIINAIRSELTKQFS